VDLSGMEERFPNQLSGGQQQRIAVARALATHPKLLLLDEPLSSLDTGLRKAMREELQRIVRAARMTVINVTHDQDEAMFLSDRIVLLRNGTVQQSGPPADLYHRPRSAFIGRFMGPANVITGTVVDVAGGFATLQVGERRVRGSMSGQLVTQGETSAILCRPEDVVLQGTPFDSETNSFHGAIVRAAFAGGRWQVHVRVALGMDILVMTSQSSLTEGDVWVALPPEKCLLVEPDDQAVGELETTQPGQAGKDGDVAISIV
jgi:ABC-type Fe3+/spermidine/putrescine transport system ATPase subunit